MPKDSLKDRLKAEMRFTKSISSGDFSMLGELGLSNEERKARRAAEALERKTELSTALGRSPRGFRSSFRDWAGETTNFPRDVVEMALAHTVGDATERAYRRGDALEKRRKLLEAWARFVSTVKPDAKVIELRPAQAG